MNIKYVITFIIHGLGTFQFYLKIYLSSFSIRRNTSHAGLLWIKQHSFFWSHFINKLHTLFAHVCHVSILVLKGWNFCQVTAASGLAQLNWSDLMLLRWLGKGLIGCTRAKISHSCPGTLANMTGPIGEVTNLVTLLAGATFGASKLWKVVKKAQSTLSPGLALTLAAGPKDSS